jgi:predicted O-linked N-acetylglucosamine transferase (SPINDLY family)
LLEDLIESGIAAQRGGDSKVAAERFTQAIAIAPNNFDALQLLGLVRVQAGQLAEGIVLLRRALDIAPRAVQVLNNLGSALREAGAYRDSIDYLRQAVKLEPNSPVLLINLALSLIAVGELATAGRCLERAAKQEPENPTLLYAVGQLMQFHSQPAAAVEAYRRAIANGLKGRDVHHNLGLTLQDVGDPKGSWNAFREAEQVRPCASTLLYRAYAGLLCTRWSDFQADVATLSVADPQEYLDPFRLLHFPLPASVLRRHIDRFAEGVFTKAESLVPPDAPLRRMPRRPRVRIAYLSPDFRAHPVGVLLAGMLPLHDRAMFEIQGYAWGPADNSGIRERISAACDHFEDVTGLSYQALIARLRAAEIDIAVDLCGITGHNQLGVFASRVAPVQVNWLGYPGTTGVLDYICADGRIIPPGAEGSYTEQVVRLPHTYLPYDRNRPVAQPRPRKDYGLPEEAVVLAFFGQLRKLTPPVFDAWMQVLREVPEAVLWLSTFTYPDAEDALRQAAIARGVDPGRIIFAPYEQDPADHLARYRAADLTLDTHPYGSHSTAADALWAGCPLVSLAGDSFASRVSGSILAAAGFPQLIAESPERYTTLISELAQSPSKRRALRAELALQRDRCPLFDTPRFVKALECAFAAMHERRLQGLSPAGFDVTPDGRVEFVGDPAGTDPETSERSVRQLELREMVSRALELQRAGRLKEAVEQLERAIGLEPEWFDALQLLGVLRFRLGDVQAGIELMQKACRQNPNHAPTLNNLGNALQAANRLDEAIDCYRRAIEAPDAAIASYLNLGLALVQRGDPEAAYIAFSRACEIDPTVLSARAPRASLGRILAEWTHLDADVEALIAEPPAHDPATLDPGPLLSLALPPIVQRRYADAYARHLRKLMGDWPPPAKPMSMRRHVKGKPLRVAYLSADLREHAVGYLLAPLFEAHDRSRVTCYAYSWYQWRSDQTRSRIQRAVDQFRDVSGRTDAELRDILAEDEIDIAVDLMGHTSFARPSLYTDRIAPVHVGWLGYAGTMGEGMLDWLIADSFIIPEGAEKYYAERIYKLPGTYLPYDPARRVATPRSRAAYGLPESALVLASLGPVRKITPQMFGVWMDILKQLPEAVLWLGHMPGRPETSLRSAAGAAGVDPGRLVFATPMADNADHLARYHAADIVLDTFPYGAHSTAADALRVGCPIVALVGENFASRVSGSIVSAAGMPELITRDVAEYRERVIALGSDAALRRELRARIAERRSDCSLFDLKTFTRQLEQAYEYMLLETRSEAKRAGA